MRLKLYSLAALLIGLFWVLNTPGAGMDDGPPQPNRSEHSEQCLLAEHAGTPAPTSQLVQQHCMDCDRASPLNGRTPMEPSVTERRMRRIIETFFPWWSVSEAE